VEEEEEEDDEEDIKPGARVILKGLVYTQT